jgi:hypothetical protein
MKRLLVANIAHMLLLAQFGDACAAGAFDGEWTGSATSTIRNRRMSLAMNVKPRTPGTIATKCPTLPPTCTRPAGTALENGAPRRG